MKDLSNTQDCVVLTIGSSAGRADHPHAWKGSYRLSNAVSRGFASASPEDRNRLKHQVEEYISYIFSIIDQSFWQLGRDPSSQSSRILLLACEAARDEILQLVRPTLGSIECQPGLLSNCKFNPSIGKYEFKFVSGTEADWYATATLSRSASEGLYSLQRNYEPKRVMLEQKLLSTGVMFFSILDACLGKSLPNQKGFNPLQLASMASILKAKLERAASSQKPVRG